MDETKLIEKLRLIEALHAGATTEGERVAAEHARERMLSRLEKLHAENPAVEYTFRLRDSWSRNVFCALLRRYNLKPYRHYGQRHTTVMAKVSARFVKETLWPQFCEINTTLNAYLKEVTERVASQVLHPDSSDAEVIASLDSPSSTL